MWITLTSPHARPAIATGVVCVLALYRAISFIHELTHLRAEEVPGFHLAWNALIGVPFLTPSLMYEGVHILHHARDRYGTARDPEYHPLARRPPSQLALFLGIALLAPLGVVLRFAVLGAAGPRHPAVPPLGDGEGLGDDHQPRLRARGFRPRAGRRLASPRRSPAGCGAGRSPPCSSRGSSRLRALVITAGIYAAMAFLNQLRTAVAHAWENDGQPMSVRDQFLDTVNVPPPALLPFLWAPVGLRYHALHHLMPRLPYHNLAAAHRRLVAALPADSDYRRAERQELIPALRHLLTRMRAARPQTSSAASFSMRLAAVSRAMTVRFSSRERSDCRRARSACIAAMRPRASASSSASSSAPIRKSRVSPSWPMSWLTWRTWWSNMRASSTRCASWPSSQPTA